RPPEPRVIVGLAARVGELERHAPDVEAMRGVVRRVGIVVLRRPRRRDPELARVDEAVPRPGPAIAVESAGDLAMPDDAWSRPATRAGLLEKRRQPARVVDMSVRVDRGGERARVPAPYGGERAFARAIVAGVDQHEAGVRPQRRDVRERVD